MTAADPRLAEIIQSTKDATPPSQHAVKIIVGSKNSLASLEQLRDVITNRPDEFTARGIQLTMWGPNIRGNKVEIGVNGLTPEIKALIEHEFGSERVEVTEVGEATATFGRFSDSPPWDGGMALSTVQNGALKCTAGFNMIGVKDGQYYVSTAGHCSGSDNWYNGSLYVGNTYARTFYMGAPTDAQIILPSISSAEAQVWVGGPNTSTLASVKTFAPAGSVQVDDQVCQDGAFTGETCDNYVLDTNVCLMYTSLGVKNETCGLTVVQSQSKRQPKGGDSGGPVYKLVYTNGILSLEAVGLITGRFSNLHSLWFYTPIDAVDSAFNVVPICNCIQ
ncbi:MAG: DUF3586 domain-containing protein [Herpetosiphonaceae bacterium]|nr:DUF3586 domain-containing protein [Herpetosiphonaceae bacterium]